MKLKRNVNGIEKLKKKQMSEEVMTRFRKEKLTFDCVKLGNEDVRNIYKVS